jgi:DNA repair protein RecO (recombination protein O)
VKQIQTRGIILSRTDYGEADKIITILTPEQGKIRLMARGVRKIKSRLAGGIELFSISDITYMQGRGDLGTLISSRLFKHYGEIVKDLDRVQTGYDLIKVLNKATEDRTEPDYFTIISEAFESLDDFKVDLYLIKLWMSSQLLKLAGHSLNLTSSSEGLILEPDKKYIFDYDSMSFAVKENGRYDPRHIKALRLLFSNYSPKDLQKVEGLAGIMPNLNPLLQPIFSSYINA